VSQRAWVEQVMGLPVSIHLRGPRTRDADIEVVVAAAYAELRAVDALFSTWRPDSQVSQLRRGERRLDTCDPLVREVADLCEEARVRTDGAFSAWLPDDAGETRFDPTGLVKGWAADRAAAVLERAEGHAYCLNAGGDVVVGGRDAGDIRADGGRCWRIGIEDPRDRSRIAEVVELSRGAVATSGTAARGRHLVDPVTGQAVTGDGSVSVVGSTLTWADVWATALFVGPSGLAGRLATDQPGSRLVRL
jgi:thiamine biosynthesis lipoprotein